MILALAHRLELAAGADLAIDHALLDWLADVVGLGRTHEWLAHVRSLTGDLTGAVGILDALFPDAAFSLVRGNGAVHSATIVPAGGARPHGGEARDPANAILAAVLRAHAASLCIVPVHAIERRASA